MKRFVFLVLFVLIFIWAWNEKKINPEYINTTDTVYVVKTNTLNIREKASAKARIMGKLEKNDTIKGIISNNWLNIGATDSSGYVFADNLSVAVIKTKQSVYAGHPLQMQIKTFVDEYITLRKWYIWLALVVSFTLAALATVALHKLETQIFKWRYNFVRERINWFPYFSGFLFALLGVVSVFFQYQSIVTLADFSFWPLSKGWVAWFWAVTSWLFLFALVYSTVNGFFHYGIGLGTLRFVAEVLTATLMALALYLFSVALTIVLILGILLLFVAIGMSASSNFKMPDTSDMSAQWRKYERRQQEFAARQEKENREFWKRQEKLNN